MSTKAPAVSNMPSICCRFNPLSITCVRPVSRGFPGRAGTPRNPSWKPLEAGIELLQLLPGGCLDVVVEGVAVGVDADGQRAEVLDAKLPEALGHQLLPGDLLDLLDLGRLERRGPADDREVDHPVLPHRLDRLVREAALAADRAHAVLRAERLRETHHSRARRRADADGLVLVADLANAGRGVQQERPLEVHRRLDALVEDPDLRPVADADDVALDDDLVACLELEDLGLVLDREGDLVCRHQASRSKSTPPIPGGHGLPPESTIDSSTNCLIPFTPSAGTHILRKLMFSEPDPLGTHLTSSPSQSSMNSQWTIGSR